MMASLFSNGSVLIWVFSGENVALWRVRAWIGANDGPHLGGALGDALLSRLVELGWLARQDQGRAVTVLPAGRDGLPRIFGVAPRALTGAG